MIDFKNFVDEMTMSAGQFDFPMPDFSQAQHIGDTEQHKILHYEYQGTQVYGITVGDQVVGYAQTVPQGNYEVINQVSVEPQFQGQHLARKLLFFLKSWLRKSFLMGDVQSRAGQALIQSLARTQRFPMFWLNIQTGEKHPYDPAKDHFALQPYRSLERKTDWRVLIEGLSEEGNARLVESIPVFLEKTDWRRGWIWFDGLEEILQEEEERMRKANQ